MNGGDLEYRASAELLERISEFLYGQVHDENFVTMAGIYESTSDVDRAEVDRMLHRMVAQEIVVGDLHRGGVTLIGSGKNLYAQGCIPALALGLGFCDWKFSPAVVRISVRKRDGNEAAGTGFFVEEPVGCIVTNRHVAHQHTITRIDDLNGNEIVVPGNHEVAVAVDEDLDLALIHCTAPADLALLRVDWNRDAARPLDEVLILGYPYVALHHPALLHSRGEISFRARQLRNPERRSRESLMITRATAPGCSGGPVISTKGFVVGVVTSEQTVEREGSEAETFIRAIPGHYLRELPTRK